MTGITAIDSLRHFAGKANELQALRDRVAELEQLLGISADDFGKLRLPPQQKSMLNVLYKAKGRLINRDQLYTAIFGMRPECDQPNPQIIDVQLSKLRTWLKPMDISISVAWGQGWFINEENREKIRVWIDGMK